MAGRNRAAILARFLDAENGFLAILQQTPIIGDIIEIITGVEDGDTTDLGTWVLASPSKVCIPFGLAVFPITRCYSQCHDGGRDGAYSG